MSAGLALGVCMHSSPLYRSYGLRLSGIRSSRDLIREATRPHSTTRIYLRVWQSRSREACAMADAGREVGAFMRRMRCAGDEGISSLQVYVYVLSVELRGGRWVGSTEQED
eukprot:3004799-Prymnesium_polylepis.1